MRTEMAETVRRAVADDEYASTGEVVREALRDWVRISDADYRDLEALRTAVRADLNNGPGIAADEVFVELRARYAIATRA